MPNIKSAKKRVKTIAKKRVLNNDVKTSMRTAIKNVEKAVKANDKALGEEKLKISIKAIDNALQKGVIKANTGDRYKSRVTKLVSNLE